MLEALEAQVEWAFYENLPGISRMILRGYPLALWAAGACAGYGLGLGKLLGVQPNLGDAGILGLTCLAILGCVLHFFTALSPMVQTTVLATGLMLAVAFHREIARQVRACPWALAAGATALFHRQAITFYDTGLYHLQTFRWNSEFPVTLGLGNLHDRLAFNSSIFLLGPLDDRLALGWISNFLALAFVLMACYARSQRMERKGAAYWFLCLSVCLLALAPQWLSWTGVLNADGLAALLGMYWFGVMVCLPDNPRTNVALLVLTGALAVTVKLSAAPLLLLAAMVVWVYRGTKEARPYGAAAAVCVLLGCWVARGFLLSGCAVYPVPLTCRFDLPWAVSRVQASAQYIGIRAWARDPQHLDYAGVMANWNWVSGWLMRTLRASSGGLFLCGAAAGLAAWAAGGRLDRTGKLFLLCVSVCLLYWVTGAPDVRFGSGYLAAAGVFGISVACAALFDGAETMRRLTLEAVLAAILIGAVGFLGNGTLRVNDSTPVLQERQTAGGKSVWVTQGNDQCWDSPLPCTPYYNPDALGRVRWR